VCVCADALLSIHSHIKGLGFLDDPDYAHLRTCLQQLPNEQVQLQLQHLIAQGQQAWEQNGLQQQPWDNSPLGMQQQQHGLPPSPYVDGMSPLASPGLALTGGGGLGGLRLSLQIAALSVALDSMV
jgi:hypothetical protein